MTDGEDSSLRFLPRIRQELDKLALTDEQKDSISHRLLHDASFFDRSGGKAASGGLKADSALFDFADKIQAVVNHFQKDGLTAEDYLKAVIRRPDILEVSPDVIARNINGVVDLFTPDGLTTQDYLKAALKQPSLFIQTPWTLSENITGLVQRFAPEGLTDRDYLQAALKLPSLFTLSPSRAEDNIRDVAAHFRDDGMTSRGYLTAALSMPSLFALTPATVTQHINAVMSLAERGIFNPPKPRGGQERTGFSHTPARSNVIDFLLRNPRVLTFADDNIGVREVHQVLTGGATNYKFIQTSRTTVEQELMRHLGHGETEQPVPSDGFIAGAAAPTKEQAERFVLRALMHAGFIRSGSMER